jgi:hypothetical protein
MIVGAFVLPPGRLGITEASTTRRPATPQAIVHHDRVCIVAHAARADLVIDRLSLAPMKAMTSRAGHARRA